MPFLEKTTSLCITRSFLCHRPGKTQKQIRMKLFYITVSCFAIFTLAYGDCITGLKQGVYYQGGDQGSVFVPDVEYCQIVCTFNPRCIMFSYLNASWPKESERFACLLKDSVKVSLPELSSAGAVSGHSLKHCTTKIYTCRDKLFPGLDMMGTNYNISKVANVEQCREYCTNSIHCQFFTYVTENFHSAQLRNRCYIRTSKNGEPTEASNKENMISGFSLQSCKTRPSVCPLPVISNAGDTLHEHRVFMFSMDLLCSPRCKCYLKMSSNGLPTAIEHGKGGISGFSMRLCKTRTVGGCGQPVDVENRIVGGKNSYEGEWPWQVSMHIKLDALNIRHVCGGSIISNQWIVTAAHCVQIWSHPRFWVVYSGITKLSSNTPFTTKSEIEQIIIHPDYIAAENGSDIALLKLKVPLTYNDYQQAICLPPRQDFVTSGKCWITGWGYTEESGTTADVLQKAEVPVKSSTECQKSYSDVKLSDKVICAGYEQGDIDSCKGDSGGPLVCEVEKTWYLTGITSWGEGCARPDKPGVYTKVTEYIEWIVEATRIVI
ncbi:plasma kallikrein-like [Pyxicephalus adspersus]|uniref:plasma kallikrein-like n=1 Tax=Pyxicephalus adspersus TaxID=30357 RepID=UPI003B5BD31E